MGLPLLVLVALVLLVFHDVVFAGRAFYERDISLMWVAQADAFVRVVTAGSWPVWNPYSSFGQPMLANPNNQALYPFTWLNLLARPETYYGLFVVFHLVLAGVGFHLLARRLSLSPLASLVGAAAWLLSGSLLSTVELWNHLAGAAWLPWVVLAAHLALSTERRHHALWWGLAMAAQVFSGSPESLLAGGVLALGLGWPPAGPESTPRSRALRTASTTALAVTFGLALSAAQWIPTLVVASWSARVSIPADLRTFWSIHPYQTVEIGVPLELSRLALPPALRAVLFESREAFLASLYSGLPALALIGAAVASRRRKSLLLLGLAVGATLLALGRHGPVYEAAVTLLPPLRAFRYPAKAMIVTGFALALLTGMGLDVYRRAGLLRRGVLWVVLPLAAALLVCTGATVIALGLLPDGFAAGPGRVMLESMLAPAADRLAVAALLGAAMLVLQLASWGRGAGLRGAAVAGVVVILDLFVAHRDLNPTAPREVFGLVPSSVDLVRAEDHSRLYVFDYALPGRSRRYLGHDDGFRVAGDLAAPWRGAAAARLYPHPFTLGSFGLEGSYAADTIMLYPPYLETLTRALFDAEETPAELRLLQAGAVGHVIALHERGFEDLIPVATWEGPFVEPIRVFRVPDPLPRSYVVGTARVADDATALVLLSDRARDLRAEAFLAAAPPIEAGATFTGSSEITAWRPDRVQIRTRTNAPALAVLVDTYDPGWRVAVDGAPATARRVNLAFRGVEVPAGQHRIEWVYRPAPLLAGLAVSGIALVAAVSLGVWWRPAGPSSTER